MVRGFHVVLAGAGKSKSRSLVAAKGATAPRDDGGGFWRPRADEMSLVILGIA